MWADAQRYGRPAEYRLSESSVIPFLARYRKVWLMPAGGVCSNAANIGERKTWT